MDKEDGKSNSAQICMCSFGMLSAHSVLMICAHCLYAVAAEASSNMKKRLRPPTDEDQPEPLKRAARARGGAGSAPGSKAAKAKKSPLKCPEDDSEDKKPLSDQLNFPETLMQLINENMAPDYVSWIETEEAISFMNDGFQEHVLDKFFQGLKYDSFVRKLNRW
jgi:hypothetical protein